MNKHKILKDRIHKVSNWISSEGPWLTKHLNTLPGIVAHPSAVNFQLIEGQKPLIQLREELKSRKILLRDCRSFIGLGDNWLRISLQTRANNKKIFSAIQTIFNQALNEVLYFFIDINSSLNLSIATLPFLSFL